MRISDWSSDVCSSDLADALRFRKETPEMAIVDADLEDLFVAWFDVGFLELQRITWNSPAALLEKLIAYDAVHAIESWAGLRNRPDADRRCSAFFHPRIPLEPRIFVGTIGQPSCRAG